MTIRLPDGRDIGPGDTVTVMRGGIPAEKYTYEELMTADTPLNWADFNADSVRLTAENQRRYNEASCALQERQYDTGYGTAICTQQHEVPHYQQLHASVVATSFHGGLQMAPHRRQMFNRWLTELQIEPDFELGGQRGRFVTRIRDHNDRHIGHYQTTFSIARAMDQAHQTMMLRHSYEQHMYEVGHLEREAGREGGQREIVLPSNPAHRGWAEGARIVKTFHERMQDRIEKEWRVYTKDEAEMAAKELLEELIGSREMISYEKHGRIVVRGKKYDWVLAKSGAVHRVERKTLPNIVGIQKRKMKSMCIGLQYRSSYPPTDNIIAMKLAIEGDERAFSKECNVIGTYDRPDTWDSVMRNI